MRALQSTLSAARRATGSGSIWTAVSSSSSSSSSAFRLPSRPRPRPRILHNPGARHFSSTPPSPARVDHYAALKLPRNASQQQIKAKFYELSKKHHPDAPGGSPDAFHAINDAYSVLGDAAAREAYDRAHVPASQRRAGAGSGFHPHSPEARRSSGPHRAWDKPPPGAHWRGSRAYDDIGAGMGMGAGAGRSAAGGTKWTGRSAPTTTRYGRKEGHALGAAARARRSQNRLDEEVKGESMLWRFTVMAFAVFAIVGLVGKVAADTGEECDDEGEGEEELE